jgi:Zn finger protein HypA/HybF involved in hydrogenase expression
MKLTELKNKIDEALRLQDDYDVKVNYKEIDECNIDDGRFNFNIFADDQIFDCDRYHIVDDDEMEYCESCEMYYPSGKDCPGCKLKELRKRLKLM